MRTLADTPNGQTMPILVRSDDGKAAAAGLGR